MKATEVKLLPFLQGTKQFVIPIYQRTYSWKTGQWQQLWNDVRRIAEDDAVSGHFVGSVVYVEKGLYQLSAVPQVLVIDGQQRLTTLSLLLAALGKAMEEQGGATSTSRKKITNYYLVNGEEDGDLRHKLVLTQSDRETLARIIEGEELPGAPSARIVEGYRFFEEQIRKSGVDLDRLFGGISKLIIVDIALDRERDNPQLIFESLNSTGLDLSQADLIRNYVLMGLDTQEQADIYRTFWYPMEQRFGHAEYTVLFDRFMRDYLTVKTGRIPNIDAVYTAFKAYAEEAGAGVLRELIADVARFSKYFVNLAMGREEDTEIRGILDDINTLKVDVAYPFLLEVYDDYAHGRFDRAEFIALLRLVESYVFRRAICGIPTNSLNKTFATLAGEIDKGRYLESVRAVFLLKDSYRRFPRDDEFRTELVVKDIYHLRVRNYVLRKLENHGRKERVNVEEYTIEHILPQNEQLPAAWRPMLGPGWAEIQSNYLHTLGNLTLTGYNSELSDRPFPKKREMAGGFADSPIRLNRGLAKLDRWDEGAINKRAKELARLAVQVWVAPSLDTATLEGYRNQVVPPSGAAGVLTDNVGVAYLQGEILVLFEQLRKRVLNLDASVREEIKRYYIAYKTTTNFVDVEPQKKRLRLTLNMPFAEVNDPLGICQDFTGMGRWGNGDVGVDLADPGQIDDVMALVGQSFERQREDSGL